MKNSIRILFVSDKENETTSAVNELKKGGLDFIRERVDTKKALKDALEQESWDCILEDSATPGLSVFDVISEVQNSRMDIPVIVISAVEEAETVVTAIKAGARNYVLKNKLMTLPLIVVSELQEAEVRKQKWPSRESLSIDVNLLWALLGKMPGAVYIKDNQCRRIYSNAIDVKFIGCNSQEEVLGKTDQELFSGITGKNRYHDDLNILESGISIFNREEEFTDGTGTIYWNLTSKIPIRNEQGEITGIFGYGYDITKFKLVESSLKKSEQAFRTQNHEYQVLNKEYLELNNELRESINRHQRTNAELVVERNRAEESYKLKSEFLANMSHEIRTPLNTILGFAGFLKDEDLKRENTVEYLEMIESSSLQLMTIINDILEISQIEAGQLTITEGILNVNTLLKNVQQQFKKQAEQKNLNLENVTSQSTDSLITITDETRVRQVMSNLLDNAIKFTESGKVEFGCSKEGNYLSFFVRDSGFGIAPEYHPIIFKPFRTVETTPSNKYRGNGLGLSIAKALVEKLGGNLTVVSEQGKGSTFTFTIPIKVPIQLETGPARVLETSVHKDWNNRVVLVVEDEMYNYSYIEKMLTATNIRILHAWDGQEAIDLVKMNPDISLVLMDIKMPVMDGYTATLKIKELRPELPIIAQTAFAFSEDREKALNIGFDNYLTKPTSKGYMLDMIETYIK
jgi:signal transduction histidine kinase/DNA-binding response OmpR family regulator